MAMRARVSRRLLPALLGAVLVVAAHTVVTGQAAPAGERVLLGTWKLDLAKSKYFPGPAPLGETRTYTADDQGVKGVITRVYADRHTETIEWRANYDHEQAVTGTPAYDAITMQKVDDNTSVSTLSHAGVVYGTARRVISPDGSTLTITFERKTADDTIRNVAVYRRAVE
jgi:hypothetical protein